MFKRYLPIFTAYYHKRLRNDLLAGLIVTVVYLNR